MYRNLVGAGFASDAVVNVWERLNIRVDFVFHYHAAVSRVAYRLESPGIPLLDTCSLADAAEVRAIARL